MNPTNSKTIICYDVPLALLHKTEAKRYFKTFGPIVKIIVKPKSNKCIVEYQTAEAAQEAFSLGGEYEAIEFPIEFQLKPTKQKENKKTKPKKDPDPDWDMDDDVKAELEAMGMSTGSNFALNPTNKKQYNLRPEKMAIDVELNALIKKASRGEGKKRDSAVSTTSKINKTSQQSINKSSNAIERDLLNLLRTRAENTEDKYRLLDARDKLIRLRRFKNVDIHTLGVTVGTCPDMCPEKERLMREVQHQVALYEQTSDRAMNHSIAVKQYSRSSADQEAPLPHELRGVAVLQMTMGYLMHRIMRLADSPDCNLGEWYHFLWDRMRGIRKDITQQELCSLGAVQLVEQCARFHVHCSARLVAEDAAVFDQKINTENLTKCLQTLKYMYNDLAIQGERCPDEAEFRAYVILLNLNDGNFMWEVQQLPVDIQKSGEVKFALEVYSSLDKNNFVKFFKLVRTTTYLNACILLRYFVQVRTKALRIISRCYTPRMPHAHFPIGQLTEMLAFESEESCAEFVEYCGLTRTADGAFFVLNKRDFQDPDVPYVLERAERVIESKRRQSLGEVVCGQALPPPVFEFHATCDSFTSDGYLKNLDEFDVTLDVGGPRDEPDRGLFKFKERSNSPFESSVVKEKEKSSGGFSFNFSPTPAQIQIQKDKEREKEEERQRLLQQQLEQQQLQKQKEEQLRRYQQQQIIEQQRQQEQLQQEALERQRREQERQREEQLRREMEKARRQQEEENRREEAERAQILRQAQLLKQHQEREQQEKEKQEYIRRQQQKKRIEDENRRRQEKAQNEINHVVQQVVTQLIADVEESCRLERLAQLKTNLLLRFVVTKWRSKVTNNQRKRKAIDQGPLWMNKFTTDEIAKELYTPQQNLTLHLMKRYKRGVASTSTDCRALPLVEKLDSEKLRDLTANYLLANAMRTKRLQNDIFWKVGVYFNDDMNISRDLVTKTMDAVIGWDQRNILLKKIKVNQNNLTYCLQKTNLGNSEVMNGLIIVLRDLSEDFVDKLIDYLNNLGDLELLPVYFILEDENPRLKEEIETLVKNKLISEKHTLICDFTPENLAVALGRSLNFLARHSRAPPPLLLNTLRAFLGENLGGEFFQRVRAFTKWNLAYKQCVATPNVAISLFNQGIEKLSTIISSEHRYDYPEFPQVFREFLLINEIPDYLPCDYKYFPSFWRLEEYNLTLKFTLERFSLPEYQGTWPLEPGPELERNILDYCKDLGQNSQETNKLFLKIVAKLLKSAETGSQSWIDVVEVILDHNLKTINFDLETNFKSKTIFNQLIVVYQCDDLLDYVNDPWYYLKNPLVQAHVDSSEIEEDDGGYDDLSVAQQFAESEIEDDIDLDVQLKRAFEPDLQEAERQANVKKCKAALDDFRFLMDDLEESMKIQRKVSERFQENLKSLLENT